MHLSVSTHPVRDWGRVSHETWLGQLGMVTGITYTWNNPGGPASFGCKLLCDPKMRNDGIQPGRVLTVWAGAEMWRGTLDEPTPADDGWTLAATGIGSAGNDAVAYATANAYYTQQEVDDAIRRGALPWKAADTYPPAWGTAERASISITDSVDYRARFSNGGRWHVDVNGQLSFPAAFTQHTRFLAANTPGGGRTLEAYANALIAKYTVDTAGNVGYRARSDPKSIAKHGKREEFIDLSSAGITTAANVDQALDAMLARYGHRARWSGAFACSRGMVLMRGGVAEEPCAVRPNNKFRLMIVEPDFGGEVDPNEAEFVAGETSYDADADVVTITPQESARRSLQDVLVNPKITKKS